MKVFFMWFQVLQVEIYEVCVMILGYSGHGFTGSYGA